MLYFETVESHTLSILEKLQALSELRNFSLVGGTALALLFGHRKSVDLDLFSHQPFDNNEIIKSLAKNFSGAFDNRTSTPHFGIFCFVENVKVDLVRHAHPLIRPLQERDGLRLFSVEDIAAMKVQAVLQRGRKKDFWDIAELLQHISVADFIRFHAEKYATQNLAITVPQAITYFADAEDDQDPVSLKRQTWKSVKEAIQSKVNAFLA